MRLALEEHAFSQGGAAVEFVSLPQPGKSAPDDHRLLCEQLWTERLAP